MPVQVLVNGFFRSGTSIFWKILKESNQNYTVFYEPCHDQLPFLLERYRENKIKDNMHGMLLWEEYLKNKELFEAIKWEHPNVGSVLPLDGEKLCKYVKIYHDIPKNTVLQSNRWHFFLREVKEITGCKLVHIIRNPFDIYNSIQKLHFKDLPSGLVKYYRNSFGFFLRGKAFGIDNMYEILFQRYGKPVWINNRFHRIRFRLRTFHKFLICWTLSNLAAMQGIGNTNGYLVIYENMINDPEGFKNEFEKKIGINFQIDELRKNYDKPFLSSQEKELLFKYARKLCIENELSSVLKGLNRNNLLGIVK